MVLTNNNTMGFLSKQIQVQSQIWALIVYPVQISEM